MKSKFQEFFAKVIVAIQKPEMRILPGQLAFFFVLSVIPLIALLGSLSSFFGIQTESIIELLESILPKAVLDLLIPIVAGDNFNFNIFVFYISAFILASNGTNSMIISSNELYKSHTKSYLFRRIKAFFMTVILVLLLIFVLIVPAFGDKIILFLGTFIQNDIFIRNMHTIYNILKFPLSLVFIFFNVKLLYVLAPDKMIRSRDTTIGSFVTTLGWIIATEVYSIYVDVFARYNIFYGSLSNILILLLWVYLLAYIFVFGMALNVGSTVENEEE